MKNLFMKNLIVLTVFVSISALSQQTLAGDATIGKSKAAACAACHGNEGVSSNSEWPDLAGQQESYLVNQLKNFRDGSRKNTLMSPMAASLSDDDIANIAAYYASLK